MRDWDSLKRATLGAQAGFAKVDVRAEWRRFGSEAAFRERDGEAAFASNRARFGRGRRR